MDIDWEGTTLKAPDLISINDSPTDYEDLLEEETVTEEELRTRLAEALAALRDKERDLNLAAEIGQQLVAVNTSLMTEYESLLKKKQSTSSLRSRASLSSIPRLRSRTSLASLESPTKPERPPSLQWRGGEQGMEHHLASQLDTLELTLLESERSHRHALTHLRTTNAALQDQLRSTLQDLRDVEERHARAVGELERELEGVREELVGSEVCRIEVEDEKKRLVRESTLIRRDSHELEKSDAKAIDGLTTRARALETANESLLAGKRAAEERLARQRREMETVFARARELEGQVEELSGYKRECMRQERVIDVLVGQLEDMRGRLAEREDEAAWDDRNMNVQGECVLLEVSGAPFDDSKSTRQEVEPTVALTPAEEKDWDWGTWVERTSSRFWERDVTGIKTEISDLSENRTQAYALLRVHLRKARREVIRHTPQPIASLATMIGGAVPAPVVGMVKSLGSGVKEWGERKVGVTDQST
ncbi:hypothetical protein HKX48_008300 [Thoreauomyces humboldtii]|nr:hypothetical protein HKX48_008300 [Thoreauomyces humboldtii]